MQPVKILSWNIEHFKGETRRLKRVVDFVADEDPDVFGLIEVEGSHIYDAMTSKFPGYNFHITEGRQTQEILIGVRSGISAFFTQKNEFRRSNPHLRPGALLTLRFGNKHLPILFTHLKSAPSPEGFGLRDAMYEKVFDLKKALDKSVRNLTGNPNRNANFIVLGDLNTMGFDWFGRQYDIDGPKEIHELAKRFRRRKMRHLDKSHPTTWSNGSGSRYPDSDLDHVFAAEHMGFDLSSGSAVTVGGWAQETTVTKKDRWIEKYSDHCPLILTVTSIQ